MSKIESMEKETTPETPLIDKYSNEILGESKDNFIEVARMIKEREKERIERDYEETLKGRTKAKAFSYETNNPMANGWIELMVEISENLDKPEVQEVFNKITLMTENQLDNSAKKEIWGRTGDGMIPVERIKELADDSLIVYQIMEKDFKREYMEKEKLPGDVEKDRERLWHFQEQLHKMRQGYLEKLERFEKYYEDAGKLIELKRIKRTYRGPWLEKTLLTKQDTEDRSIFF